MPKLAYKFRKGDVRHCFADISKIRDKIGFDPKVSFSAGMGELIDWAGSVDAVDRVDDATDELQKKGLLS